MCTNLKGFKMCISSRLWFLNMVLYHCVHIISWIINSGLFAWSSYSRLRSRLVPGICKQFCRTAQLRTSISLDISNNQFTVQGSRGMRNLQFRIALCFVPCAFCIWLQLSHWYLFVSGRNASSLHRLAPANPYCVRNSILSSWKYRRSFPVSQRIKLTKQQLEKYQSQKYRRS